MSKMIQEPGLRRKLNSPRPPDGIDVELADGVQLHIELRCDVEGDVVRDVSWMLVALLDAAWDVLDYYNLAHFKTLEYTFLSAMELQRAKKTKDRQRIPR